MDLIDEITLSNVYDGEDGQPGKPGEPGAPGKDGQTLYTWNKYADDALGNGMSDQPEGKKYIGLAFNKTTPVEGLDAREYTWSLIKGEDGIPGKPGEDGTTLYTWIRYSAHPDGTDMSPDPTGMSYMGIAYNKPVQTPSTNKTDYVWSLFRGAQGIPGEPGKDGQDGQDGQDAYSLTIISNNGNVIKNGQGTIRLTAKVYKGANEFDASGNTLTYSWRKYNKEGVQDQWSATGKEITINQNHVNGVTTFRCTTSVGENVYSITDLADVVISTTPPVDPVEGQLWKNPETDKLMMWDGTKWIPAVPTEIIGGVNKVRNSTFYREFENWGHSQYTSIDVEKKTPYGNSAILINPTGLTGDSWSNVESHYEIPCKAGQVVSAQWKVFVPSDANMDRGANMEIRWWDANGSRITQSYAPVLLDVVDQWQWVKVEGAKAPNNTVKCSIVIYVTRNGKMWAGDPQLEFSTSCSDYRPAPEDLEEVTGSLVDRITNAEEKIEDGKIISTVLESVEFKDSLDGKANADDLAGLMTQEAFEEAKKQLETMMDGKIDGIDFSPYVTNSKLEQTKKDFNFIFQAGGGVNGIKDSIGWASDHGEWDIWRYNDKKCYPISNTKIESLGFGSAWHMENLGANGIDTWQVMDQKIVLEAGKEYTFSCYLNARTTTGKNSYAYVEIYPGFPAKDFNTPSKVVRFGNEVYDYEKISFSFVAPSDIITLRIGGHQWTESTWIGMMLNIGKLPLMWTPHPQEIYNANTKIDGYGIKVIQRDSSNNIAGYTSITPKEFAGYAFINGVETKVFWINGDETTTKKVRAEQEINIGSLKMINVTSGSNIGVAFIPV